MKVDVRESTDHLVEEVVLSEARDLDVEVELLDDLARPGAEPGDVAAEVPRYLGRVVK